MSKLVPPDFMTALKERIYINEQIRRYGKVMQLSFLAHQGKVVLTKSQAEAGKVFMMGFKATIGRFIPELKAIEHTGEIGYRDVTELRDEELETIAATGRDRVVEAPPRTLQ